MAAEKRAPEDRQRLTDLFAVVSTATVQDWARSARRRARVLRDRAEAELEKAADLGNALRVGSAVPNAGSLRARLHAAEVRAANLERAQRSNRRIGMAIGILMARHSLTEEQAFAALRVASSRRNMRLARVAEEVVYTGFLEIDTERPPGQRPSA